MANGPTTTPAGDATPPAQPQQQTPPAPSEQKTQAATSPSLTVDKTGDPARVNGTGLEPGKRYDVSFTRPDDRVDSTTAVANESGNLQSFGRIYLAGKYSVSLRLDGNEVASAKFTV